MNEQLQKVLADIITRVTSGADAVVEFSKQQLPEVLKQLLIWEFTYSLCTWLITFGVVLGYIWWMSIKWTWWIKNKTTTTIATDNQYSIITFIWSIAAVVSLIMLFNNLDWLKIWVAPKLYLLEYAASLIKSST